MLENVGSSHNLTINMVYTKMNRLRKLRMFYIKDYVPIWHVQVKALELTSLNIKFIANKISCQCKKKNKKRNIHPMKIALH